MTEITREEIDAKLNASEARWQAADARMSAHETRVEARLTKIDHLEERLSSTIDEVRRFRAEVASEGRNTRLTIVITLLASLLAFAGAMWTAQANLLAAFQAGLAKQAVAAQVAAPTAAEPAPAAQAKSTGKASLADAR